MRYHWTSGTESVNGFSRAKLVLFPKRCMSCKVPLKILASAISMCSDPSTMQFKTKNKRSKLKFRQSCMQLSYSHLVFDKSGQWEGPNYVVNWSSCGWLSSKSRVHMKTNSLALADSLRTHHTPRCDIQLLAIKLQSQCRIFKAFNEIADIYHYKSNASVVLVGPRQLRFFFCREKSSACCKPFLFSPILPHSDWLVQVKFIFCTDDEILFIGATRAFLQSSGVNIEGPILVFVLTSKSSCICTGSCGTRPSY